jgi:hypothetical protein
LVEWSLEWTRPITNHWMADGFINLSEVLQ